MINNMNNMEMINLMMNGMVNPTMNNPMMINPMINGMINPMMNSPMTNGMINPMMNNTNPYPYMPKVVNPYMNQQMANLYMIPQNPYATNPAMTTSINIEGVNGQIQAIPNFIQNEFQNLNSIEELKKKLEKSQVLRKECRDFTFILSNTDGIYFLFKRKNKEWINQFSKKLWNNTKYEFICENKVIFIPNIGNFIDKNILDNDIAYFLINKISPYFFIKKINKEDYLKINDQILCINTDNLLEKIEKYEPSYFFISPEKNKLIQDFTSALSDDNFLFVDEKTKKTYSYDSLPKLKELENHLEEVKDYVR